MENQNIEVFFKDIANDLFENLNKLAEIYEETKPKIIKRVYRINGKKRYRKMIRINFMHEMYGLNLNMNSMILNRILKYKRSEEKC